jgi:NAD(P)-dependent dehydrogenase (short-subunit alcohol dehydrogenase family)
MNAGFDVVLAGRHAESLNETLSEAPSSGHGLVVPTDVRDPAGVTGLFAAAEDRFGRLDVIVNNAGVFGPSVPIDELDFHAWASVIDTNVTGMFLCAQAAFRLMKNQDPQGGRIINNGSLSAHVPRPNAAAYTTSKHAVSGLTKAIALEGRPFQITCGQIDVGNAATAMTGNFGDSGTLQADGTIAVEPTISVNHVARAIVYMATLPLDVSVPSLTVLATGMPYLGRG